MTNSNICAQHHSWLHACRTNKHLENVVELLYYSNKHGIHLDRKGLGYHRRGGFLREDNWLPLWLFTFWLQCLCGVICLGNIDIAHTRSVTTTLEFHDSSSSIVMLVSRVILFLWTSCILFHFCHPTIVTSVGYFIFTFLIEFLTCSLELRYHIQRMQTIRWQTMVCGNHVYKAHRVRGHDIRFTGP